MLFLFAVSSYEPKRTNLKILVKRAKEIVFAFGIIPSKVSQNSIWCKSETCFSSLLCHRKSLLNTLQWHPIPTHSLNKKAPCNYISYKLVAFIKWLTQRRHRFSTCSSSLYELYGLSVIRLGLQHTVLVPVHIQQDTV